MTAEQRNRNPARLRAWRAKGAIVMAYVNLIDYIKPLDPIQNTLYGGNFPSAWFYPGNLSNWPGTRLLDLRASSAVATYNGFTGTWGQYAARWIRNEVIKDGTLFNGVFLDVWGARLWGVPSVPSGPGSDWEAGIAKWGQEIRNAVGPTVYIVGNNHQTHKTAQPLNGKMWESFDSTGSGYNQLTGRGESEGLIYTFEYPEWDRPQLDILWRNEANPSQSTKDMLVSAAKRVTKTGSDIVVGSSDHQGGFPAPFGGGGGTAPGPVVLPGAPGSPTTPGPRRRGLRRWQHEEVARPPAAAAQPVRARRHHQPVDADPRREQPCRGRRRGRHVHGRPLVQVLRRGHDVARPAGPGAGRRPPEADEDVHPARPGAVPDRPGRRREQPAPGRRPPDEGRPGVGLLAAHPRPAAAWTS